MSNTKKPFVLITGASAGIGKALAFEFARRKKNLLLVSLPDTGLNETMLAIRQQHAVEAHAYTVDLTAPDGPAQVFAWCKSNAFRVEALVNNAGFGNLERLENTQPELLTSMMNLNNSAVVLMTHLFIPELKKCRQSYILNVGSLASFIPLPSKSVYAATKSFVYAFSYSLYFELKPENIHVSCLCPGGTLTERVRASMDEQQLKRGTFCQSPEAVALTAVRYLYKRKFRIIPGRLNQALYWLSRTLPRFIKIALINAAFSNGRERKTAATRIAPSFMRAFALINR